ncbi:DUF2972 domain-containing protein, partial [Helicobacter japonicus]|uniref:DUF2972 domain-containing protein n=1 Tax=Helicobacter japonicus TaxID=425400 RepID=UPI00301372CF
MGRGSKIYHRFGLKWALAYRCKKLKRKIKNNTPLCLQKTLMFFRILKLKNANKFKIYKILIQCHCIIDKQKHLEFIAEHYEEINSWLNSKEFKEKYINTNHPYPPLLNPERLNAKVESCKDNKLSVLSLRGTNKVRDKAIHNVAYFKDSIAESRMDKIMDCHEAKAFCNNECQSKSAESIQPYPNLSYESIPPELAWDLNLPLPPYYQFICIGRGVSGHAAFCWRFFPLCGDSAKGIGEGEQKTNFIPLYHKNDAVYNCIILTTWWNNNRLKQASLLDKNVPVIFLVRDPISRLKSAMNHGSGVGSGEFALGDDLEKVLDRKRYYKNSRTINPESLKYLWRAYDFRDYTNVTWFRDKEIIYVDMQEIMPNRAFETMAKLSKIVGFNPPKLEDKHLFEEQSIVFELAHTLPLTLKVECDCDVICIKITRDIHANTKNYLLNSELTPHQMLEQISIGLTMEHYTILSQNKLLLKETLEYLNKFVLALWEKKEWIRQMQWNEAKVLEYLRDDKSLRNEIYEKLKKELVHIKANRPDIVESWKYYQEFERMCEE